MLRTYNTCESVLMIQVCSNSWKRIQWFWFYRAVKISHWGPIHRVKCFTPTMLHISAVSYLVSFLRRVAGAGLSHPLDLEKTISDIEDSSKHPFSPTVPSVLILTSDDSSVDSASCQHLISPFVTHTTIVLLSSGYYQARGLTTRHESPLRYRDPY